MTRTEPDFHGQQMAVQAGVAKVMGRVTDLMQAVTELLTVVNNPKMIVIIDPPPSSGIQEQIKQHLQQANDIHREQLWVSGPNPMPKPPDPAEGLPPSMKADPLPKVPGDVILAADTSTYYQVEAVLRANDIPFRRLDGADYVLTEHVVTSDVKELFESVFKGTPHSVNGLVNGPFADLRRRPDLFKPKGPPPEGEGRVGEKPAAFVYGNTTIVSDYTGVAGRPPWLPDEESVKEAAAVLADRRRQRLDDASTASPPPFDGTYCGRKKTVAITDPGVPNSGDKE